MQTRIKDLELSLDSIHLLVKNTLKRYKKNFLFTFMFCLMNFSN